MKAILFAILAFPLLALADGAESAFDGTQSLTAEEEKEAENYIHAGKADRVHYEMCADDPEKCYGEDAWDSGSGMSKLEKMMPVVTKAYAAFTGLAGGDVSRTVEKNGKPVKIGEDRSEYTWQEGENGAEGSYVGKDNTPAEQNQLDKSEDKTEDGMDVCGKLPVIVEGVSVAYQTTQNNQTQQSVQSTQAQAQQRQSFLALSKMHKDRASAAKYQAAGWGSVAACYVVDAAAYGAVRDWKLYTKIAAATLITGFYLKKVDAHNDKASLLKKMADTLPGAGDCNPHTDTSCFCAEESSYASDPTNYMKYCVPKDLQREGNIAGYACADKDGKADVSCKCKSTNSCIQASIVGDAMKLGLNPAAMKNPLQGLKHLSTGHSGANLGDITRANLAMAKKSLSGYKPKVSLNSNEKDLAKDFSGNGLPAGAAATLAKYSSKLKGAVPESLNSSVAAFNPGKSKNQAISSNPRNKAVMKSGSSARNSSRRKSSSNPFARKSRSSSKTSSVDIIDFAEKAAREAEITKDKSKPIFEIITYRYKMRAWKEFKDEMREHTKTDSADK